MKLGDSPVHPVEISGSVAPREIGQGRIPENASLDHLYNIELWADNGIVGAQAKDVRNREAGLAETDEHLGFVLDGLGTPGQPAGGLSAQHAGATGRGQLISRIRRTTAKLLNR